MRGLEGYDDVAIAQMHVLRRLAQQRGILRSFLEGPDHFSIRATDFEDFSELLKDVEADADQIATAEKNQRQIAIARLSGRASLNSIGIGWVEIVEPQPQSAIQVDIFKSNGLGFYVDDVDPIFSALVAAELKPSLLISPIPMVAAALGETDAAGHVRFVRIPMDQFVNTQIQNGDFKEMTIGKEPS